MCFSAHGRLFIGVRRLLALMGSGKLDVKPLITDTFGFPDSIKAFDYALHMPTTSVKVQIIVAKD